MPSRPFEAHRRKENRHKPTRSSPTKSRQHGNAHHPRAASGPTDALLTIPSESLTHVTSFLVPPDLLALARTCQQLNAHVADDNTWLRAYVYHYLGIAPENDLHGDGADKTIMLRREESSWRKEFIQRYKLRRRWEYSRNTTITHIPHHSMISGLHLMPHTTLLAASLQYGVASRSYPLSGKVLRGFLDASGTLNGLGIGNPNAEFSPHVSSIALASEGGTAKVLWGFRNGDVAVTTALRAMDHNRTSAARLARCRPSDCHEGPVECVAWATGGQGYVFLVSGGADGRVKLWEVSTAQLRCLWTSDQGSSLVPDPCVKIAMDYRHGVIVSGLRSGTTLVWTGFDLQSTSDVLALETREIRIPPPASLTTAATTTTTGATYPPLENTQHEITDLRIAPNGDAPSLLVAYRASPFFHRLSRNSPSDTFERTFFGDENAGSITAIFPAWASRSDERTFIITGDQLGNISIYPWVAQPLSSPSTAASASADTASVHAVHRLGAHEDGAVTALAWNSAVLVSGSSRGTIKVWDALTFASLRSFPSPAARPFPGGDWDPVSQILLEPDTLLVSVGSRVLAWKAGPVGRSTAHGKGKVRTISAGSYSGVAKWQRQIEMYKDISESRRELEEEKKHSHRTFGREKEQLSTLAHLGLSEVEAVEYVLMLSRDEEETRRQPPDVAESSGTASRDDEGVFIADFDDVPTPMATRSSMFGSEASSAPSSRRSSLSAHSSPKSDGAIQTGRAFPRVAPSSSNHKVQVSPRRHPEPMEAGLVMSPLPARRASLTASGPPPASDLEHFPAVVSRTSSSASASGSSASLAGSAPGSPQSIRSAWSTPLRSLRSSEAPSPSRVPGAGSASPARSPPARATSGVLTSAGRLDASYAEEDDGDLRFALELSLAEARSRGEDV